MGEKFKNKVCEPKDNIDGIKRQIFELIGLNQTVCKVLPNLNLPTTIPNVSDLNPSQAIIDFLTELSAIVSGINFDEMRMQLINWLVENLEPLSKDLGYNLKLSIKSCYACKVDPTIPAWLFQTQPGTSTYDSNGSLIPNSGTPGIGFNVAVSKIDLTCLFAADPNTEIGRLFYDGDENTDMNAFLWKVIQENGNPVMWRDSITGSDIAEFRYYENNPVAYLETSSTVDYQDINQKTRVFNMRISDRYEDKSLITFLNDYFNSQNPLFDSNKIIPRVVDLLYGTLTNKIKLPDECLNKVVEMEESVKDYINNGIDNPEIVFDDSFYEFSKTQKSNIKDIVSQKKLGVKKYKNCCGNENSSISFETLKKINTETESASNLQEKLNVYTNAMDDLLKESSENVSNLDKGNATADFLSNFITSLQIAIAKMLLSPKNLMLMNMFYFLVNKKSVQSTNIKEILKEYECIIRDIISELIRKLVYDYLLPMIVKALIQLAACVIVKKLKEINDMDLKSLTSYLPPWISDKIEKAKELSGKADDAVEKLKGFSDKVNLNSLNNISLQFGNNGRFCD
jgi:hypothetical protein